MTSFIEIDLAVSDQRRPQIDRGEVVFYCFIFYCVICPDKNFPKVTVDVVFIFLNFCLHLKRFFSLQNVPNVWCKLSQRMLIMKWYTMQWKPTKDCFPTVNPLCVLRSWNEVRRSRARRVYDKCIRYKEGRVLREGHKPSWDVLIKMK